mmetsp:Transcript_120747/g.336241  ORF Transcript_120747/g.336241 Transcript_120747/m.336241 type:complete len:251 (+) Transcript_120747:420-1172(+)
MPQPPAVAAVKDTHTGTFRMRRSELRPNARHLRQLSHEHDVEAKSDVQPRVVVAAEGRQQIADTVERLFAAASETGFRRRPAQLALDAEAVEDRAIKVERHSRADAVEPRVHIGQPSQSYGDAADADDVARQQQGDEVDQDVGRHAQEIVWRHDREELCQELRPKKHQRVRQPDSGSARPIHADERRHRHERAEAHHEGAGHGHQKLAREVGGRPVHVVVALLLPNVELREVDSDDDDGEERHAAHGPGE